MWLWAANFNWWQDDVGKGTVKRTYSILVGKSMFKHV